MTHTFRYSFHVISESFPQLDAHHGHQCNLVRALCNNDVPMYEIEFADGFTAEAFADEVSYNQGD